MNQLIKVILSHLIIFTVITSGFILFVFVSSFSNALHPDAYKDAVMSVVYVYGAFLIIYIPYKLIMNKTKFKESRFVLKINAWNKQSTLFDHIAIWFTIITVINSIMMLTGIDVPKQGTFAYVHLLTRLMIVTVAVCIYMFKHIIKQFKLIKAHGVTYFSKHSFGLKSLINTIVHNPIISSFKLFTLFTVVYCLINIALQSYINPKGGAPLYTLLLIVFGGSLIISIIQSILSRKQSG